MSKNNPDYYGWDIGGAHLKLVIVSGNGEISRIKQYPTPLWQGLEVLRSRLSENQHQGAELPRHHALTITGELSDLFRNRQAGVESLLTEFAGIFQDEKIEVYAGNAGLLPLETAIEHFDQVASANWHATASYLCTQQPDFVLMDIGSTTTDLILAAHGDILNRAYSDQERLAEGGLVYTGLTRTPVMAVVQEVEFAGQRQAVMAELFATMADVYRITGELDPGKDLMPTADGADKSLPSSGRRLARMLGTDFDEEEPGEDLRMVAEYIADQQLQLIEQKLDHLLELHGMQKEVEIIGAGAGRMLAEKIANRKAYMYTDMDTLLGFSAPEFSGLADCAAAFAVAQLARIKK